MATKDYAQDGVASYSWLTGTVLLGDTGVVENMNDGNDNSYYYRSGWVVVDPPYWSGTYEYKIQVPIRFAEQLSFITKFTSDPRDGACKMGFKLQYYDGSWHTLYTQTLTTDFAEAKTIRSYTNGGAGFENITYIRVWVEWWAFIILFQPEIYAYCYSQILNSQYYPASGIRFKISTLSAQTCRPSSVSYT